MGLCVRVCTVRVRVCVYVCVQELGSVMWALGRLRHPLAPAWCDLYWDRVYRLAQRLRYAHCHKTPEAEARCHSCMYVHRLLLYTAPGGVTEPADTHLC